MDLTAYSQIGSLDDLAKKNGIAVPRLRGYRLMSEQEVMTQEDIDSCVADMEIETYEHIVRTVPRFCPNSPMSEFSSRTDQIKQKFIITETVTELDFKGEEWTHTKTVGFRWNLIHGKKRKALKFALKKARKAVRKNLETFNKYVGSSDVLYIHARIGGNNWSYYGGDQLEKQPWFLEKVDDYYDSTYCDIYAKIDPDTLEGKVVSEE